MSEPSAPYEPVQPLPEGLDPDVARWCEIGEARAIRDAVLAAERVGDNPMGWGAMVRGETVAALLAGMDFFFFNRVTGLGMDGPVTAADIAGIRAYYAAHGITQEAIQPGNGIQPPELADWLAAEGYVQGGRWVKMWHDLADPGPRPADRRITVVQPGSPGADDYRRICLAAFEMPDEVDAMVTGTIGLPGWTHYLGYEADVPVAVAAQRIEDGVGWQGYGATLEEHRGKGWQTAMFRIRLNDAKDAGCRFVVTETGEESPGNPVNPSYRNMVRTGFQLAYARRNWYRPAAG